MNYISYKQLFDEILNIPKPAAPYKDTIYLDYAKLNRSRMKRWNKQLSLDADLVSHLKKIKSPQHWIIITEPWCGDAAHIVPFLIRMTEQNEYLTYDIQLRDTEPFLIESYLTNNSKSIPKLIVRDEKGNDLFIWGPRPKQAQELIDKMKAVNADFETSKIALQNWYNEDKGISLNSELIQCLEKADIKDLLQPAEI
ncbi:hypothetical protein D3C85_516120 [compost metagenome]